MTNKKIDRLTSRPYDMNIWIETYKNHTIHCSVYISILLYCHHHLQQLMHPSASSEIGDTSPILSWSFFFYGAMTVLTALLLKSELVYVWMRLWLPPGDSGYPIIGHVLMEIQGPRELFCSKIKKYGSPMVYNVLMKPVLTFSNDDDVAWWLSQERIGYAVGDILPHFKNLFGTDTITFQQGAPHKMLRRIFEPVFSPNAIRKYTNTVDTIVQTQLQKWCGSYQSTQEWALLALRLFFACGFGDVKEELLQRLAGLFEVWINGFLAPIPFVIPGTVLYKAHEAKREMFQIFQEMINDFRTNNPPESETANTTLIGRLCYSLDDNGNNLLSDQKLIDNIHFFMFAGHDTIKGSFGAFIHYLNKYPSIRQMLCKEAEALSDPLLFDELKSAPLLNAFMAETWRIIPPLHNHATKAAKDLQYKGYYIRKGTKVSIDIQAYNILNEKQFPDATEFRIERWLPPGHPLYNPVYYAKNVNYQTMSVKYRAFNAGAHTCVGSHFAKLEARIVLVRLLRLYSFTLQNEGLRKFPFRQHTHEFKLEKKKQAGNE